MNFSFPSIDRVATLLIAFLTLATSLVAQERPEDPEPAPEEVLEQYRAAIDASHRRAEYGGKFEDPTGRHEWFMFQRSFPYPYLPAGVRQNAIRETEILKSRIADAELRADFGDEKARTAAMDDVPRWRNIGPFNTAGRIRGLLVHPNDQGTIYVGAASGGVWKNEGDPDVWVSNFDKQTGLAIGSMAFDPTDPEIIYVGTGEVINSHTSTFNATPAYFGDGMFKSTDGGETWSNIGLNFLGTISAIYVRRDNPQIVFAASAQGGGGLYRSSDGGENWSQVSGIGGALFNIEVSRTNEDHMLISSASRIYYSFDGGERFAPAGNYAPTRARRTEIAIAPSDPATVYALVARSTNSQTDTRNFAAFYVSSDSGQNWSLKSTFGSDVRSFFNGQGHYNNCIAVHPTKPQVVLVGGIDIFRTSNGGTSFSNTTLSYRGGDVHPDQHIVVFDPKDPSVVFLGNDGGVYRSDDEGRNWDRISASLPITQYYEIGLDQSRPYRAYGGTQDNGTQGSFDSEDWAHDWPNINGGDGFHVVVDPQIPDFVYAESQYGVLRRIDTRNFSSRYLTSSLDRTSSSDYDRGSWSTPLAISDLTGALYTGRGYLWQSVNRGSNWDRLDPGNSSNISTIGLGVHNSRDLDILIGTTTGELRRTTDGGSEWVAADENNEVPSRYISEIVYDPVDPNRVYVVASGVGNRTSVFRSDDRGATFTNITNNLPNVPHSAFAVHPTNNSILFAGNDIGVFLSLDGGEIWLPFDDGLPYVPVVDLEVHRSKNTLVAGTHGRSIFEISIDNPRPVPVLLEPLGGSTYQTGDTIPVAWAGFGEPVRIMISYNGGASFDTIGVFATGTSASIITPFLQTTNAIVRIENLDGDRAATSNPFAVSPTVNTDDRGGRGFVAGAIALRDRAVWVADREAARIVQLRLPALLPGGATVSHSFDHTRLVDLAYDEAGDRFVVLLADTVDYSGATLHFMAIDGTTVGTPISAPVDAISGVTLSPEGVVLVEAGENGRVFVLDRETGALIRTTAPLDGGSGGQDATRRGLVYDEVGYVQGVDNAAPGSTLTDVLDRFTLGDPPSVIETTPLVVESQQDIDIYGMTPFERDPELGTVSYYATSRDGRFFLISAAQTLSVRSHLDVRGSLELLGLSPNPVDDRTELRYRSERSTKLAIDVFSADGARVLSRSDVRADAGSGTIELQTEGWASGLYRVVVTATDGSRDVVTAIVTR